VPSEAQWCSLCFADLREPVRERSAAPAYSETADEQVPVSVAAHNGASSMHSAASPDALLGLTHPDPDENPPVGEGAEVSDPAEARWPCLTCDEKVPLSLDVCPSCGAGFLAGSTTVASTRLPVVGDIGKMSRTQRLLVGCGIGLVVMVLLIILATIGGHVF
jgi:hypothetical protein